MEDIRERIHVLRSECRYYAPWLNIVQSTGTGKTRSVFEYCERYQEPLYYVCHRPDGDLGYPARTADAFKFLHGDPRVASFMSDPDTVLFCRYVSFFFHLYVLAAKGRAGESLTGGWMRWRRRDIERGAGNLYMRLIALAKVLGLGEDASLLHELQRHDVALGWVRNMVNIVKGEEPTIYRPETRHFVVFVDGISHLRAAPAGSQVRLRHDRLFWLVCAARVLDDVGGVLITADSRLETVSLQPMEVTRIGLILVPTTEQMVFTRLPWQDGTCTRATTVGAALTHKHVISTGRPLWTSMVSVEGSPSAIYERIRRLLLGADTVDAGSLTPPQAAALLCARVSLTLNPDEWLGRELVASHLAMMHYVTLHDNGAVMATVSYTMDAAVAHSARLLWEDATLLARVVEHTRQLFRTGLMEGIRKAEVVAQVALLRVIDKVTASGHSASVSCNLLH